MVAFKLREASACRAPGNDCRHESIYAALHFRALTAMSPLQFQKQLRLHAARQRMLTSELDAASAAFEVGYESPSQFNRQYRRFFGQPPNSRYQGPARRQSRGDRYCLTLNCWVAMGAACSRLLQTGPYRSLRLPHV
jgi:AraC-like DNA-binding protein